VPELDCVLDTSAIVCVLEDEPGADLVGKQLGLARAGKTRLGASCVSLVEVYYRARQLDGEKRAHQMFLIVKSWPVEFVYPDDALCLAAGEIKALFPVSFADAFIAATAREANAVLLHKDPEFESLRDTVKLQTLPYKPRR
jgi:predicted nucleic acid-binding protein